MIKSVQSILFATDLSKNCQQALEYTLSLGIRYNAVIYMIHVIEEIVPGNIGSQLKDLLGTHKWNDLVETQQEFVKKSLLGKQATNAVIRGKVQEFCKLADIDSGQGDFQSREIILAGGDVVDEIIAKAKEHNCDLIVMGAKESLLSGNSIGTTIKSVLKDSPVAVTVVPGK